MMRDGARPGRRARRSLAALAAALPLAGCQPSVLAGQGPVGAAESNILLIATVIMLAIIVPTMIGTLAFAWWFRETNTRARYRPDWAFSGRIELVIWSVPFLTIVFLGGIAWIGAHQLDPAEPLASDAKPIDVQVVSLDWKWLFIYPEQKVAALNQLVVPVSTPIRFHLTSSSVWNSFFVPGLGSMIYTMRGMVTRLNLMTDRETQLHGLSTHFSGDGFSDMHFPVRSVSAAEFDAWVRSAQQGGPALDEDSYARLARQSRADPPRTFGSVDPDLFRRIVDQTVPPGPGPDRAAGTGAGPDVTSKGGE